VKVSGFTFVRNAIKYDYPIIEAIQSILPICDEFVVAVGNSDDGTLQLIKNIASPKIKIIETIWDDTIIEGGKVLALETDKAFAAVSKESDWAFYLQGDEVIHEKYLDTIKQEMLENLENKNIEGLLLKYEHFYGSYAYVGDSYHWYRREIRIVRNNPATIKSYKDAQGFRTIANKKLKVKLIDAYVYHYGMVKPPVQQKARLDNFVKYWSEPQKDSENTEFDYSNVSSLAIFNGTHPQVMLPRINAISWRFNFDVSKKNLPLKYKFKRWFENLTGLRIGEYRNYRLIK
jgi:hypothetical protein